MFILEKHVASLDHEPDRMKKYIDRPIQTTRRMGKYDYIFVQTGEYSIKYTDTSIQTTRRMGKYDYIFVQTGTLLIKYAGYEVLTKDRIQKYADIFNLMRICYMLQVFSFIISFSVNI